MGSELNDVMGPQTEVGPQDSYKVVTVPARELQGSFRNLVFAKFLRSLKQSNYYFRLADPESYFSNYHKYIERLLAREKAIVKFAVLSDSPDVVLGWALYEPGILHYVWVDSIQRQKGIARTLCSQPFQTVTHLTTIGAKIFKKLNVTFDPWR